MQNAFIVGLAGPVLRPDERTFIAEHRPAGLILFARNCENARQISDLVAAFNEASGARDRTLILIDQEGGRVQRIRSPTATVLPAAAAFLAHANGDIAEACRLVTMSMRLTAAELKPLGINTDCAPVLDVPVAGSHNVIGNRAFSNDPATVVALGRAAAAGLMAGGMLPVMKHVPGHGRACSDSHFELPVVDQPLDTLMSSDFMPFRALAHLPAAMTAHVVFSAVDGSQGASTSRKVTDDIIRKHIGFSGLLMSDDLGMKALAGDFSTRTKAVIHAGCDLALHCSGNMQEMVAVAEAVPVLQGVAQERFSAAVAVTQAEPEPFDLDEARDTMARMLAKAA
ncbi:MAG: beta-N-acetylhexosaminidase [Hyphomicrobiaceae bacterium]